MRDTTDPDGRLVILTDAGWEHIVQRHDELIGDQDAILDSVAEPVARNPGHAANEEWFYGQGFGPSRFVLVVVHFRGGVGSITTAFPRRRFP